MINTPKQKALWASILLGSAVAASANVTVNFQVDMSTAVFDPATQVVAVNGTFNGWNPFPLTNNPAGPTPTLWTGSTNISGNGTVIAFKYTIGTDPARVWEGSHNRLLALPTADGSSITAPKVYFADVPPLPLTVSVTFQVDLAQQIKTGAFDTNTSLCYARGGFNSWGTVSAQTNDPTILRTNSNGLVTSNVYVFTYEIAGSPGQTIDYKYYIDTGVNWESPAPGTGDPTDNNNRFFSLADATNQALPIVFFNDAPYAPVATNDVTFQVDMSSQILVNNFDPATGTVEVRGNFNSWGSPQIFCTNDPSGPNTNIYRAVVRLVDGVGASEQYKFFAAAIPVNSGWETLANNRTFLIRNAPSQVLPVVLFSDIYNDPADYLPAETVVTFTVNMTNAVGTDGLVFNPATNNVYINGVPTNFVAWDTNVMVMLTNNPIGSELYSVALTLPKGHSVNLTYKYSIDGLDNDLGVNINHVRYVRQGGSYVLPLDKFGTSYSEPSFGELAVGPASGGQMPLSWLGRVGVHVQSNDSLTGGTWKDWLNTDGATWANGHSSVNGFVSTTNVPTSGGQLYLRLVRP